MTESAMTESDERLLAEIERKVLWLSAWTIHHANHVRPNHDGVKIGGHLASCASVATLMTALYFRVLRPQDRVAVKPHASPVFHAIQYLLGNQDIERLKDFRGYGGAQSYPSRTKDRDDVDFSTGSVGLGVAMTAFASLVQDYIRARDWDGPRHPEGRMIALVGDAELDEGNIYECLQEGWKQGLRNTWWIIDYNRQSLDGVVREGLSSRLDAIFRAFGWEVALVKYGVLQRAAFEEPGGQALKAWIDSCPNPLYSALTFQGGAAWRKRLMADIGSAPDVAALLDRRDDEELGRLMANLGGHCMRTVLETLEGIDHDRPVAILAYTVKGWGTPLAGHKDNHAGLMTRAQTEALREAMGIREGHEWEPFEGLAATPEAMRDFLDGTPFNARGTRRETAAKVDVTRIAAPDDKVISTQAAFGKVMHEIAGTQSALAERILTTSPDVTVSTNLGAWVNRRNLFAREEIADTFRDERVPSAQKWRFARDGQHFELGIAEMNFFLMLGAAGLGHQLFGERLIPIGTLYDPFISRGLDALNYACYQDARFLLVGTPSGVSLAPEGGAHQSIATPLIGLSQDGLAAFEPAFADELAAMMEWGFDYLQRDGDAVENERTWLRDETGGSVYLRLSTRPVEQISRHDDAAFRQGVIDGAYWLREPGPGCDVVIAYQGVVATEAIAAAGLIGEDRRDVGVLAVTSADRLNAGWQAAQRQRRRGHASATSHIERLVAGLPAHTTLVTAIDGHPATLSWLGSVCGHVTVGLGVEHFGQTGSVTELYRHYGIDRQSIAAAASAIAPGRPVRWAAE